MEIKINLFIAIYFVVNSWLSGLSYCACREGGDSILKSSLVALLFLLLGIIIALVEVLAKRLGKLAVVIQLNFFYKLYSGKLLGEWKSEEDRAVILNKFNGALLDSGIVAKQLKVPAFVRSIMRKELNRVNKFTPTKKQKQCKKIA